MALAAHDLLSRDMTDDMHWRGRYRVAMLHCKLRSLNYAQGLLSRQLHPDNGAGALDQGELDCLLLIITLQTLLETITGSSSQMLAHLLGGLFLVRQCGESLFSPEVYRFATDYLSLSEVFLSSTGVELDVEPLDGWLIAQRQALFPALRTKHGRSRINPCTGISSELVTIIGYINAALRHQTSLDAMSPDGSALEKSQYELQHLEVQLANLDQWSDDPDTDSALYLIAGAFELAAWIYLRLAQVPSDDPRAQNELVSRSLTQIERVHERQGDLLGSLPYPLWALFITACAAPKQDSSRVSKCFEQLTHICPSNNVSSISNAVMYIWEQRQVGSVGDHATRRILALPWQVAVQNLKLKTALII